jgi:hypothetical protein
MMSKTSWSGAFTLQAAKRTLLTSAIVTCALAMGSFAQGGQQQQPKPVDVLLAKLSFHDSSSVEFHEAMPGELIVFAKHPAKDRDGRRVDAINGVRVEKLARLSALEKYRALSGGLQAPPKLVEAQKRYEKIKKVKLESDPRREDIVPPRNDKSNIRGSSDPNCETSWNSFDYCWQHKTGDGTIVEDSENMDSSASPYRGDITHIVEYESCFLFICSWNTSRTQTVSEGWVGHIYASGPNRTRRAMIRDSDGDGWDWHVGGGDQLATLTQE